YLVFDWALAVIVLVIIVRSILHPITKWSQIRMQRFAKQMQEVAPKQKKLQERYKDDPQRLRTEMARLWREEGVSPAGMLGCLPMFLQSPVWIALYAVLFYAIDLRQDPAFFGVFQHLFNGWAFLGDLSQPDRAIYFGGDGFRIPLISALLGPINSFNILPILLGFVFFVHQKYLTPPTSATMTPEQKQQQKIIRIMSVVLFPVIMYNAPSGLALYFVANSAFAIVENKWIRAHMDKHGLLDLEKLKEQRKKKPTFMQRLQQRAQQIQEQRQLYQAGGGKGDPRNQPRKKAAPPAPDRFKKRK
ncbi:MAG: YidC/Oxa1 family membrane protein insertase, partial [Phycisphaerales bacterium JB037]